ncbi:HAAS signaling domain-containing protein [Ornithinibacillus sp. 179-J 7C1 HS]|uniref:HAAS signaling domain-containing protein n=1 Tax=Ornithinibacillus sp. 179-J 7C1 HS TaxID=3142384 RepID=UPI00399F21E1
MNKEQFLTNLHDALKRLPSSEREDILQDFREHFEIGISEGKTEEEIAKGLGTPQQIAKELVATFRLEQVQETATTGNVLRAVWAVIGLGFFNLVIVLGPFIALAGIVFSGWAVGVSCLLNPILYLINVAIYPEIFEFYQFFLTIAFSGVGIFVIIGMYYVTKWFMKGFVRYLQFNVRMVKGGIKNA